MLHPRAAVSRRAALIIALAVLSIGAATFATPAMLVSTAGPAVEASPCGTPEMPRPPGRRFFGAVERLDFASRFPVLGRRAAEESTEAALACLETYHSRCAEFRDPALEAARAAVSARLAPASESDAVDAAAGRTRWQAHVDREGLEMFCERWADWREWLSTHDVDAAGACALCADFD